MVKIGGFGVALALVVGIAGGLVFDAEDFVSSVVVEGDFQSMLDLDWIPGDLSRLIVCEKRGLVWLVIDGVLQSKPFLDISDEIVNFGARGLTACMVDTDFENHPNFYVSYVDNRLAETDFRTGTKGAVVARYEVTRDLSEAINPVILMGTRAPPKSGCSAANIARRDNICLEDRSHNMGGLVMSPDGRIFVGIGDAASVAQFTELQIRAQNLDYKTGKVHCITRTGQACGNNPFIQNGDRTTNRATVWNFGVRNPFRMCWDPVLRIPLIANVGMAGWESIWPGYRGFNYAWPCKEAQRTNLKATFYEICDQIKDGEIEIHSDRTLWDYRHTLGAAATGVVRLHSNKWPAQWRNKIAVADYTNSWVKLIEVDENGLVGSHIDFISEAGGPVQLKEGPDGWLYMVSILTQQVIRIEYRVNTSRPEVVRVDPPPEFENAERTTEISVKFSKNIKFSTVTKSSVRVVEQSTVTRVPVDYTWKRGTNTVIARPRQRMQSSKRYKITVTTDITDTAGRVLKSEFSSYFRTGTGFAVRLSEIDWISSTNGDSEYRVFRDKQFPTFAIDVPPLSIRGTLFESGIAMIAPGKVEVAVPTGCKRLQTYVGVDDVVQQLDTTGLFFLVKERTNTGVVKLYESDFPVLRTDGPVFVDVDVTGANSVILETQRPGSTTRNDAIATWGSPRFRCGGYDDDKANVVSIRPTGVIDIDDSITVNFSESMDIASTTGATRMLLPIALGGYIIGFKVEFTPDQKTMKLTPNQPLDYDTEYTLTIDETAMDLAGNGLKNTFVRTLKTEAVELSGEVLQLVDLKTQAIRNPENIAMISQQTREMRIRSAADVDYLIPSSCGRLRISMTARWNYARVLVKDSAGKSLCDTGLIEENKSADLNCDISGLNWIRLSVRGSGVAFITRSTIHCALGSMNPRCEFGDEIPNKFRIGDVVRFSAKCYNYKGYRIPTDRLFWIVSLIHCQTICHRHEELTEEGVSGGIYEVPDHGDFFFLEIQVFVSNGGRSGVSTIQIRPSTVSVTVRTMPPGLTVSSDSLSGPSPLRSITVVGSNFTINAVERERGQRFAFWDDDMKLGPSRFLLFNAYGGHTYNAVYHDS
uniref:Glycosyl hydrolase family 98 putative carbohydrate-binding module domain-containing protein n=1 Tax=Rhodosorus marinus TaxID=101924 RepID=A0A7S3EJH5_9RHOD|mmetsp:Transcript_41022/g.162263  ORF Transcript_41022/g.162263 Transcript_41022/m.162263 type:complete len:1097 (+) Transcript_41022:389-3679(+)|eukprot:CAMPEP_0113959544 /NCGR_PEP_ID=MMETSP0011_2-20120614/4206_1 /TAXON_ID=101924 /ORGANISM="Rhodosorus marinus" /LENGTH=1096 /DNA_ID=CAMNT_0000970873 /DNA_START=259 /DNA_END=3549 /DNA_ORIENTATION=+ /assembly_acc=CAM_ASM_000156